VNKRRTTEKKVSSLYGIKALILILSAVTVIGCTSKSETPAVQNTEPGPGAGVIKSISGENVAGPTASPKDRADAEAAAIRVLAQLDAGQFSALYNDSSLEFKQIGEEASFVTKFQQTGQRMGPLKDARQASFVTLPGQTYVLVYLQENDRLKVERRLTFVRSRTGKMELVGLNQEDAPRQ
jgi:hypothetical protein